MKYLEKSEFGTWTLFSVAGLVASLATAGLVPRLVHASDHRMFEDETALAAGMDTSGDEKGAWDAANNPSRWQSGYEYRFDQLPLEGAMENHTPWSDTYWPSDQAGIAARWQQPGSNGFKYKLLSEAQVRALPQGQLAKLSPAEKYDIYMGRFDYPTVKMVRDKTSPHAESWEGICNGWSPAAINLEEPAPVLVTGASGIAVPFGSDDVKALLDEYYANNAQATEFLGLKCNRGGGGIRGIIGVFTSSAACDDVNAGALHVILANELGLRHQGLVADVDRTRQVWNQPVYGFHAQVVGHRGPSHDAAPGTVREVLIHASMSYANEIDPSWLPVVGTKNFNSKNAEYDYSLELDAAGRIIGGQYYLKSNQDRPDFLWNAPKLQFTGYYEGLNGIYRPAGK